MPSPDTSICASARRLFETFGEDAAGAAFNLALKMSANDDAGEEARWLAIAVEIMRIQDVRRNTVAQVAQLAALGAITVR